MTNAHVVAGVTEPIVEAPGQPAVQGRVVAYDDENDLALIAVSGLATPALPIADSAAGDEVAVAGYPFGGPLEVRPARVMSVGPITIEESGRVKGELRADALVVGGHVNGSLTAITRIVIWHSAVVDGSLAAPLLNVVEGAQLNAKIDVTGRRNEAELKIAS